MVAKECRRRPIFIIITIAAKVTDRSLRSYKWGVVKSCTCRKGQTEQVAQYWPPQYSICHTPHTQFEAGGSQGAHSLHPWLVSEEDPAPCPVCDPDPNCYLCIPEYSSHLLLSPVWDFLVLPGSWWWDTSPCNTQLRETQYWFCIFCFISLISIITVINKTCYIKFVSLSLFLLSPFLWWEGRG